MLKTEEGVMKEAITLFLAVILLLGFSGCRKPLDPENVNPSRDTYGTKETAEQHTADLPDSTRDAVDGTVSEDVWHVCWSRSMEEARLYVDYGFWLPSSLYYGPHNDVRIRYSDKTDLWDSAIELTYYYYPITEEPTEIYNEDADYIRLRKIKTTLSAIPGEKPVAELTPQDFHDAGVSTEGTNYDTVLLYQERENGYENYREFYMFSVSNGEFLFTYETNLSTPLANIEQYASELIAYCSPEYATNPPYPLDL